MPNLNLNVKKQGKGKNITIVILILLLICTSSYIAYKELYDKPEKKVITIKEKPKTENLDVTSEEVTSLFNSVNELSSAWTSEAYYGWLFKQDSLKTEDMSDELKVANALYNIDLECQKAGEKNSCYQKSTNPNISGVYVIQDEKVKENMNKIFGDVTYNNVDVKNFDCSGNYKYNKEQSKYINEMQDCGYGGASHNLYDYRITKAVKSDNAIDIYIKVLFEYFDFIIETDEQGNTLKDNTRTLYADFNKTKEISKIEDTAYDFNEILENKGEELPVYKLHFEKNKDSYYFKSIEKE